MISDTEILDWLEEATGDELYLVEHWIETGEGSLRAVCITAIEEGR